MMNCHLETNIILTQKKKTINYKNEFPFTYCGRNGTFKCKGLILDQSKNYLTFYPVNSKGNIANCNIEFPIAEIDTLVEVLTQIKEEHERLILK